MVPATLLALGGALCVPGPARGAEMDLSLRHGQHDHEYKGTAFEWRPGPWWTSERGRWELTAQPALEVVHFHLDRPHTGPQSLTLLGGRGVFRFQRREGTVRPYAEAGLGAAWLSNDRLGGRELSTRLQFSENLGLGLLFAGRWRVGWQYTHYSNGGIKEPNNGLDLHQLVLGVHFSY